MARTSAATGQLRPTGFWRFWRSGTAPEMNASSAAQRWLSSHHRDMNVPGFVGEAYDRWPHGLAFYYSAVSTQVFRALKVNAGGTVIEGLRRTQRSDGSWANPENLVKEDDPLIATAFAVRAMVAAAVR